MDMSYPSASLIVANSLPRHKQGLAGSVVDALIRYSVAVGLGIAGTVGGHTNGGGTNVVESYRSSLYTGLGLAGLNTSLAAANALKEVVLGVRQCRLRHRSRRSSSVRRKTRSLFDTF